MAKNKLEMPTICNERMNSSEFQVQKVMGLEHMRLGLILNMMKFELEISTYVPFCIVSCT